MVFEPAAAPAGRDEFMTWFEEQTEWSEDHGYDDPAVSSAALRAWYLDVITRFPPLNGPHANADDDSPRVTDYSVGTHVIYAAFAWSEAESAFATMFELAKKHRVGFFDVSDDEEEPSIWLPTPDGGYAPTSW